MSRSITTNDYATPTVTMYDHTPEPWLMDYNGSRGFTITAKTPGGNAVVVSRGAWANHHADALLIQAAPALLRERDSLRTRNAALVAMLGELEWCIPNAFDVPSACPECWEHRRKGHTPNCRLAALLRENTTTPTPEERSDG